MEKLGDILSEARTARGITMRQLARDINVSAMYISEIENHKKIPLGGDILSRIAVYLGLDPAFITRLAFQQKSEEKTAKIEDNLSLAVARKALEFKDEKILKEVLAILDKKGKDTT
jgi:transcriptional regulator with XRE-family HTH domain